MNIHKLITALAGAGLVGGIAFIGAPSAHAAANDAMIATHVQMAKVDEALTEQMRASTPVTEQLHDSLPATADTMSYTWSGLRFNNYNRDDGSWTGYSTGYRVLYANDSTLNQRRLSQIQFTANSCPDPGAYVDRLTFAEHRGGTTGTLVGTGLSWHPADLTSKAYCNWDYYTSASQAGWLSNVYAGTWTIHVATYDDYVIAQAGHDPAEASDYHSF